MRKLILLFLASTAFATTAVTGHIATLGTTSVTSNSFARFWLRGCGGNQPRVGAAAVIAPSQGGVFFFDIAANSSGDLSGVIYSNRDFTGLGDGEIECGGSHTATWYGMQIFYAGKGGPETPILAKNTDSFDISNITPITTIPVVTAPTGDSTYARLDAGNQPFTGNVTPSSTGVLALGTLSNRWKGFFSTLDVSGAVTIANQDNVVYVDGTTYPFTAAGLQSAINAACNGSVPGQVYLPVSGATLTAQITVPNNCSIGGFGSAHTKLTFSALTTPLFKASSGTPANIRLRDFWIDGSSGTSSAETCIDLSGNTPTDITVDAVDCSNFGGSGISVAGASSQLGSRIRVNKTHVRNGGLAGIANMYGILVSFASDVAVTNNEITGAGLVFGIVSFGLPVTSSASVVHNLRIEHNDIHDIGQTLGSQGAAIDVGRVRAVTTANNTIRTIGSGGCITFESVWSGTITGNTADTTGVGTQPCILVKQPDTTIAGEVGSSAISVVGNTIYQPTGGSSLINANGSMQGIAISGNTLLMNTTGAVGGIFLQPGSTDANIVAAGWGQGADITVTGNSAINLATLAGNTSSGIVINQPTTQAVDQVVVSDNSTRGFNTGVVWNSASVTDGITHLYVHDNAVEGNNVGFNVADAHTYNSVYYWNNLPPNGAGFQINNLPPVTTKFNAGISNDGPGFKHKRVTGCTTGAVSGNNCETTVTWTTAFADANYTPVCTLLGTATLGHLGAISTSAIVAASVKVQTVTDTAAAITGTVNCIAVHD